jgi:hypothetical protein
VKTRFQNVPFKFNLHRYTEDDVHRLQGEKHAHAVDGGDAAAAMAARLAARLAALERMMSKQSAMLETLVAASKN